jgi:hypothetical protein
MMEWESEMKRERERERMKAMNERTSEIVKKKRKNERMRE